MILPVEGMLVGRVGGADSRGLRRSPDAADPRAAEAGAVSTLAVRGPFGRCCAGRAVLSPLPAGPGSPSADRQMRTASTHQRSALGAAV